MQCCHFENREESKRERERERGGHTREGGRKRPENPTVTLENSEWVLGELGMSGRSQVLLTRRSE